MIKDEIVLKTGGRGRFITGNHQADISTSLMYFPLLHYSAEQYLPMTMVFEVWTVFLPPFFGRRPNLAVFQHDKQYHYTYSYFKKHFIILYKKSCGINI